MNMVILDLIAPIILITFIVLIHILIIITVKGNILTFISIIIKVIRAMPMALITQKTAAMYTTHMGCSQNDGPLLVIDYITAPNTWST